MPHRGCRVTDVTERTTTMVLACRLTDGELQEAGNDLASVVQDIAGEADRQADIKAQMKARLMELTAKQTVLAIMVSRREQHRDVEVTIATDYNAGVEIRTRTDTGEVISTRALRDDERQPRLPDGDDG